MATNIVQLTPEYFPNSSIGRPLASADIFVGKVDLDPEIVANQKQLSVRQESGTVVNVSQPISTSAGGIPLYLGSPVTLLVEGNYSLKVNDSSGSQVYYMPSLAVQSLNPGNFYYPDYTNLDHGAVSDPDLGAVGNGSSVKDILTEVGAVTKATMYFAHNSGAATTTYVFGTDEAITNNFNIIIEVGALLSPSTGKTLTIEGHLETGLYQIFNGIGTVTLGSLITEVYPEWWGENTTPGTTDMSVELQSAINVLNSGNGGNVYYTGETYLVGDITSYGNITHHGVYGLTKLKKPTGATYVMSINPGTGGTADPAANEMNILIEDIIFDGSSETLSFSEHKHTLNLNAVSDLIVQRCKFIHPQGDSIYLGSSNSGATERHNERIKFLNNYFDGYNDSADDGRNAITVVDGIDVTIKGNYITRTAKSNMPGGIDVEPNGDAFCRLQNITIEDNFFDDNSRGGISIVLPDADGYTLPPKGFKIINNHFNTDNDIGSNPIIYVRFFNSGAPYLVGATDEPNGVIIAGNHIDDVANASVIITGTKGTIIKGNTFYGNSALVLGSATINTGENNYDISVFGNIFDASGNSVGQIYVTNNDIVNINNNIFRDPNNGGAGQIAISFYGNGVTTTSSCVVVSGNAFAGTITKAIDINGHTLSPETNRWFGNAVKQGTLNEFLYNSPDDNTAWGDYDFDVDGGTHTTEYVLGQIPDNARIGRAWYQVITAFTSDGATTVKLGVNSDDSDGIVADQAFDHAQYAAAYHDGVPDDTIANMTVQTTAERNVILTISTADLTAGKIRVWWEYVVGE